jgi:catechol 2,3-dioxygenase-like lactoylglutathione lyase family enzyme
LLVTDIHARHERMVEQGVVFRNPPVEITEGANTGGFACYFHDPDGITLELLQPSPERLRRLSLA